MQNFFDIEVDISSMTTEELQKAREQTREMLFDIELQLLLRKMSEHKFKSSVSSATAKF